MAILHDTFRMGPAQNVTYAAAGGASAASTAFGNETFWIQVCAIAGAASTFTSGVRIVIGDGTPTATATSAAIPLNWLATFACSPGQKIAVLSNDTITGTLSVVELS